MIQNREFLSVKFFSRIWNNYTAYTSMPTENSRFLFHWIQIEAHRCCYRRKWNNFIILIHISRRFFLKMCNSSNWNNYFVKSKPRMELPTQIVCCYCNVNKTLCFLSCQSMPVWHIALKVPNSSIQFEYLSIWVLLQSGTFGWTSLFKRNWIISQRTIIC